MRISDWSSDVCSSDLAKPAPAATPSSPEPVDPHAGHQPTPTDTMSDDHGAMDHGSMKHGAADTAGSDHSTMDHSTMDHSTMDHSGMDHSTMDHSEMDHSGMDHASMGTQPGASQALPATAGPQEQTGRATG